MTKTATNPVKSRKIVLAQPSSDQCVQSLFTYHNDHAIGHKPPLGIMILATYLRANGFNDVQCLDAQLEELSPQQTVDRLVAMEPDIVGFTAWTDFWHPAWETMKLLRQRLPRCTIILGGPHCGVYPEESLTYSEANFLVVGDGEDVILNLVSDLVHDRPVADQPGLWRKEKGRVIAPMEPLAMVDDITKVPPPDRTLLPYKRYSSVLTPTDYETTMITSRGCPYKCVFCKMDVQKVYARTAAQVVDEFEQIANLGITDVQVYDDTFTWGVARAMDICQGIIDRGIKINWAIRDRANRVTPELYQLLKQAGCNRVHFGVETGSPRILKESGKFLTMEQVETGIAIAKETGMTVMAYFMFGFLDETVADARMTIDFAKKLDPDYPVFVILIPYPGTAIYNQGLERRVIPHDFWREFTKNPVPDYRIPHLVEEHMDREMLVQMRNLGTRQLYFQPRRIVRELQSFTSLTELRKKVKLGLMLAAEVYRPRSKPLPAPQTLH
jgi:radical SAM superfamily enzyme YgiQ (UPF0313 family)